MTERPQCYYCHRFISFETALRNWKHIQAPGVMDPEPYEIMWCDSCATAEARAAESARIAETYQNAHANLLNAYGPLKENCDTLAATVSRQAEQLAALRSAIRLARNRDYDGGPCWCWTGGGFDHDSACRTLRELCRCEDGEG